MGMLAPELSHYGKRFVKLLGARLTRAHDACRDPYDCGSLGHIL